MVLRKMVKKKSALIPHKMWLLNHHVSVQLVHVHLKQWYCTSDLSGLYVCMYVWRPITNKVHCLNCCYYSVVYNKSCSQLMIFFSPFSVEKKYNPRNSKELPKLYWDARRLMEWIQDLPLVNNNNNNKYNPLLLQCSFVSPNLLYPR